MTMHNKTLPNCKYKLLILNMQFYLERWLIFIDFNQSKSIVMFCAFQRLDLFWMVLSYYLEDATTEGDTIVVNRTHNILMGSASPDTKSENTCKHQMIQIVECLSVHKYDWSNDCWNIWSPYDLQLYGGQNKLFFFQIANWTFLLVTSLGFEMSAHL